MRVCVMCVLVCSHKMLCQCLFKRFIQDKAKIMHLNIAIIMFLLVSWCVLEFLVLFILFYFFTDLIHYMSLGRVHTQMSTSTSFMPQHKHILTFLANYSLFHLYPVFLYILYIINRIEALTFFYGSHLCKQTSTFC